MLPDFISRDYFYVVAGNIRDSAKYGYIVLQDLLAGGYQAVGLDNKYQNQHPHLRVYSNLSRVSPLPDVLVLVIRPEWGLALLEQAVSSGINRVWCQPGAESQAIRDLAQKAKVDIVADGSCIMVARRHKNIPTSI